MSNPSPYTVIYAFGDSLSDAGEAYLLTSSAAASFLGQSPEPVSPPYAQETYATAGGTSVTANVFSNGMVWVQDLAAAYGLANPAPGALSGSTSSIESLMTSQGVSSATAQQIVLGLEFTTGQFGGTLQLAGISGGTDFAIGGSVTGVAGGDADPFDALTDLKAQLTYFQNAIPNPASTALYTVWSGSNDMLDLLQSPGFTSLSAAQIEADVDAAVANEVSMMQSLAAGGAQSILVLNVPDLGQTPAATALGAAAAASATALAQAFDSALASAVDTASFGTAHVYQENVYALIDNAIANPSQYGLTNVTGPVYTGSLDADTGATVPAAQQNQYLFFDSLHPTETGHSAIASEAQTVLSALCFCPGTLILTDRGERPVETLAIGDFVVTHHGRHEPVRWVGRRSYGAAFVAGNHLMLPVCIKAGAIGDGVPRRDLWVSPGHGLFIDGVLAPAWRLVNGRSVVQPSAPQLIDYLHVELAEHEIILAEGAPAESFLDAYGRAQFMNSAEYDSLYPQAGGGASIPCAPRAEDGFHLHAIQRRIGARAGLTPAPALDGPLRGYIDVAGPDRVCGWAQDLGAPEAPVCLDVVIDGRRVMRVLANRFRADLRRNGIGSGCHAFEAALPSSLRGSLDVRRSSDHTPLVRTLAATLAAAA